MSTDEESNIGSRKESRDEVLGDEVARNELPSDEMPGDEMPGDEATHNEKVRDEAPLVEHRAKPSLEEISLLREAAFVFCMCFSQLMTQASVSQTMNGFGNISRTFGVEGSTGEISWFSSSFSLTVGSFILISGRIGDMFGYKKVYVWGYLYFGITSLAVGFCAYSTSAVLFDVMRAIQGIGPAIIMPNSQALIGGYYPPGKRRSICMCLFAAVAPSGFVVGAVFSGLLSQFTWWPWIFWIAAIACFIVAVLGYFVIPSGISDPNRHIGKFDYLGSISGVSGLILINFAWNQGPNVGWDKPYVYVLLIVGFLCIGAFLYIETVVESPLLPLAVMKEETCFILGCIAAGWSSFGIWLFYTISWGQDIEGHTPLEEAANFVPCSVVGVIAALTSGYLLVRFPSSFVMILALLAFFTGSVLIGTRPPFQIYWGQKFVSTMVMPLGMDMSFPAGCIIISEAVTRDQQGIAASLVSTVVNYSISIGLGIAGTVEHYTTLNMEPSIETSIHGMRNAHRMGMGLAALGVILSATFFMIQMRRPRNRRTDDDAPRKSGSMNEERPNEVSNKPSDAE